MEKESANKKIIKEILLWLFIINLGIDVGAGLYEGRIVIPEFAGAPPQTWLDTGRKFWVYVTTVPLTLLTLANAIIARTIQGPKRRWYFLAIIIIIVERVATFAYFIPTMAGLMGAEGLSQGEVDAALSQWQLINYGRHILTIAGLLAALKALFVSR